MSYMYDEIYLAVDNIEKEFTYNHEQLLSMRKLFQHEIEKSNRNELSSLKNDRFYLPPPSGSEKGLVASLDLGGTDVRAFLIELNGNGSFRWIKRANNSLRTKDKDHDYVSEQSSTEKLFDFQAQTLATLTEDYPIVGLPMGYVFSYPVQQDGLDKAVLIRWVKEINTPGVEGEDVVGLLKQALIRNSLAEQIIPRVIMNDTIGTFMASAYIYADTRIGSVIGTGYNSAYAEANWKGTGERQIVNLECGNFDKIVVNRYDECLDAQSSYPGQQKLEKMVSGYYLGELFRLALVDLMTIDKVHTKDHNGVLFEPYSIDTRELSIIIADQSQDLTEIKQWGLVRLEMNLEFNERRAIKRLAETIARRSACLIAMTYAAILNYIDPKGKGKHVIAINGSLYKKMPGYKEWLRESLFGLLDKKWDGLKIEFLQEGPAIGAAVAACMVE